MTLKGLYTIPSSESFLKRLAEGLMVEAGTDEFALTQMRVLLPTRRAGRELQSAFLNLAHGRPLLLPRLQSIGDVDAEELDLMFAGFGLPLPDIPEAIEPLERKFILAGLVQKKDPHLALDQALSLAADLARLIDQVHTEDLDFSGLAQIVPADLSDHWKKILTFLEIVTENWPKILQEKNRIDPADRRNRLLKSLTALWKEHPPKTPIIAAGSTGSIPTTAKLLGTIAELPHGAIVLPGLDLDMRSAEWDQIPETHPQSTMKSFLNRNGFVRDQVRLWPSIQISKDISPRSEVLRAVMAPSDYFGLKLPDHFEKGLENLTVVEAQNAREEAAVIAVALREVLEHPDKTACLVTSDRILARRVTTALTRWGIEADDSAGGALAVTPCATYLNVVLQVIENQFSPLSLLEFLKHPLQHRLSSYQLDQFERKILRGPKPVPLINGLRRRVVATEKLDDGMRSHFQKFLNEVETGFMPLLELITGEHSLEDYCRALIAVAQYFMDDPDHLWSEPESETLSSFITHVMAQSDVIPPLDLQHFAGVFYELMAAENYRARDQQHKRILILGQMESRLVRRDLMILAGLNEGTWPKDAGHDPWMSRPMRRSFGLPGPERTVGLAAHDFVSHASAREVLITRSLKSEGTANVPARWLQRLITLQKAAGIDRDWSADPLLEWTGAMDRPREPYRQMTPPAPCPPRYTRPEQLSATWIEKWMNNPYRVYAQKILKLRYLDPIETDVTYAERGNFIHEVLRDFVSRYPHHLPDDAQNILLLMGQAKLDELETLSPSWAYWWPRFQNVVDWFLKQETVWREDALPWIQEKEAAYCLYETADKSRSFTISAKADRIDRLKSGGAVIIDYKTGLVPRKKRMENGLSPQLPIEAYILNKGGWNGHDKAVRLMYWEIRGSYTNAGSITEYKKLDVADVIEATADGLDRLVRLYEDPDTPYIAMSQPPENLYDEDKAYAHLARTAEWSSGIDEEENVDSDEGEAA